MAEATKVAEGQTSAAAHLNAIIGDIRTHTHAPGEGIVNHGDLSDGAITGTYLDHEAINKHIQGTGTDDDPDAVGGSEGVHGLPAGVYVAGTDTASTLLFVTEEMVTDHYSSPDNYADVSFGVTFDSAPAVFVVCTDTNTARHSVQNVTTSACRVLLGNVDDSEDAISFRLLIIGVKTS